MAESRMKTIMGLIRGECHVLEGLKTFFLSFDWEGIALAFWVCNMAVTAAQLLIISFGYEVLYTV